MGYWAHAKRRGLLLLLLCPWKSFYSSFYYYYYYCQEMTIVTGLWCAVFYWGESNNMQCLERSETVRNHATRERCSQSVCEKSALKKYNWSACRRRISEGCREKSLGWVAFKQLQSCPVCHSNESLNSSVMWPPRKIPASFPGTPWWSVQGVWAIIAFNLILPLAPALSLAWEFTKKQINKQINIWKKLEC